MRYFYCSSGEEVFLLLESTFLYWAHSCFGLVNSKEPLKKNVQKTTSTAYFVVASEFIPIIILSLTNSHF